MTLATHSFSYTTTTGQSVSVVHDGANFIAVAVRPTVNGGVGQPFATAYDLVREFPPQTNVKRVFRELRQLHAQAPAPVTLPEDRAA